MTATVEPHTSASPAADTGPLLVPGRNCWRIETATRLAFLVDGEEYFGAVRAAMARAEHSILVLGWDIDSRMLLQPRAAGDLLPERLGEFFDALLSQRHSLHVHVLSWDYAVLYAFEREWLSGRGLNRGAHRRLHFRLDDRHPLGASQHQKVVVVDDTVAFVGGFDLTQRRWDSSAHAAADPRRCDPDGKPYGPFHDVQAIAEGDVAAALGELARERWRRASGRTLRPPPRGAAWPPGLTAAARDVQVAIARTEPAYEGAVAVAEVHALHRDAIAAARRHVFMENQYFSSAAITAALAQRLAEPDGPELVLIGPRKESGWLEETTMGVLRARQHRLLLDADRHGHFQSYCPQLPDDGCLNVHSKVLVVDDELLTVGSANLSNRSMGFDTECNLVLAAAGQGAAAGRARAAIAGLRARLLAEHLDVDPASVDAELRDGGLIAAIEALRGGPRTLVPIVPQVSADLDALVPPHTLIDPERPLDADRVIQHYVAPAHRRPALGHAVAVALAALAVAALVLLWRVGPLAGYLDVANLVALGERLRLLPLAPLLVLGVYVVAGLLLVPVVLLIAVTGIVFGPWLGALYAIGGCLLSAAVTFAIGRATGGDLVRRLAGRRGNRLNRELARRGLLAVAVLRLIPVAPFSVVNLAAGAARIGARDFLLGTLLGMSPGIVMTVVFIDRVVETVRQPGPLSIALLAVVVGAIVAVAVGVRRRLARRRAP